jgi:hypothetical protein
MSLQQLIDVCAPPASPYNVPSAAQWDALEAYLGGRALPPDYRDFLDRFGSGSFGSDEDGGFFDLTYVVSPALLPGEHVKNAIPLMMDLAGTIGEIRSESPKRVPYPVWPEPGGLLYAGGGTTLYDIHWRTVGDPKAWTCAVCDSACENWFDWEGDLTSLLAAIVTRRVPNWIVEGPTRFPLVFRDRATLANVRLV